MKQIISVLFTFMFAGVSLGQYNGNTTPNYPELITVYQQLAARNAEIELYNMGTSDYGLPIYLCIINGAQDSIKSMEKARNETTLLINNAIHPGEPDGVNACLLWIEDWIRNGKSKNTPVIAIIPAYNVGGMMNRSGTSRANQDGPEEYGFRGNAQNLDLNRDCIKMDSKNMFTFATIFHALEPDVFIDTHVSNGADYQYTMTYIASVKERMAPSIAKLTYDDLIPALKEESKSKGFELVPYVHTKKEVPEEGVEAFNDLPRYIMGYASLFNTISFTTETHMLKPFPQRVQSTLVFIGATIDYMAKNSDAIEQARADAEQWEFNRSWFTYHYALTDRTEPLEFKGYEFSHPKSKVTGLERLKYHQDKPYTKEIPYYGQYRAGDSVQMPPFIYLAGQCEDIIERLEVNGVKMLTLKKLEETTMSMLRITAFQNGDKPYEGHFLHNKVETDLRSKRVEMKTGDRIIPLGQDNRNFIMSVLLPDAEDSYFAWNFFDSYVQQKEYFSPYVFEDYASEMLKNDKALKDEFEAKKNSDPEFAQSTWDQLYYLYMKSPLYEPSHNFLPVGFIWPTDMRR